VQRKVLCDQRTAVSITNFTFTQAAHFDGIGRKPRLCPRVPAILVR
jgi:hypothetical protein